MEAVWSGFQPQLWRNGIIFNPQVTQMSKIWGQLGLYNGIMVLPYVCETAWQQLKHVVYVCYGCGNQSSVDISLNHDVMASFPLSKNPKVQNMGPTWLVLWYKGAPICPWDSKTIPQTHVICLIWIWETLWGGCQPQPSCNGIIFTPQVTQIPKYGATFAGITIQGCIHMPLRQHTHGSNTLYMSYMDVGSSLRWISDSTMM